MNNTGKQTINVHLTLHGRWVEVDLMRSAAQLGQVDVREYTNEDKAIMCLRRDVRKISDPRFLHAFKLYGNGVYFADTEHTPPWQKGNTRTAALYCQEDQRVFLKDGKDKEFEEGATLFLAGYAETFNHATTLGREAYMKGFGMPRIRNIFVHEVSHWLDYSINNYGWTFKDGSDEEIISSSPYKHTDSTLYRMMDACERRLSGYKSSYAKSYPDLMEIDLYRRSQYRREGFSIFGEHFFSGGQRGISAIMSTYFEKIISYQLGIMTGHLSEEAKYLKLSALGEVLGYGTEKTANEILGRGEYLKLKELMKDAPDCAKPSETVITETDLMKYKTAVEIFRRAADQVIATVEMKYAISSRSIPESLTFERFYIVQALERSAAFSLRA